MTPLPRRSFIKGFASAPLAAVPLAAVLAEPNLARAAAAALREVAITTTGGRPVKAALAVPETIPAPAVLLVHEWWGLNDQIKAVAGELAKQGYMALAVDLYDGKVASEPDEARAYVQQLDHADATDTLVSWIGWLRADERVAGKVGTVGWCFGGGWSLNASIAAPVEATVVYYGRVNQPAGELAHLKGPVLGHFATKDQWINKEMVSGFEQTMAQLGKSLTVYWYDADHAFANPTQSRYDKEDAQLAWQRTLAFFHDNLE